LAKHNIPLGPATLAAKQQEQPEELPDQAMAQDANKVLMLSDKEEDSITDNDEDTNIELPSAFEGILIKSKLSKMSSLAKIPSKNAMFTSGASLGQSTTNTMPSSTISSDNSNPALDALDFRCQEALESCPIIILAKTTRPERSF
jgi:hypothetical protein